MGPPLQLLSRVQNATSRTPAIQRTECQAHCNHAAHPRDLRRSIRRRLTGRCAVPVTPPESCSNFQFRTPVPPRAILCLISSSREMSREVPRKPLKSGCGSLLLGRLPHLRETSSRIFSRLLSIVFKNLPTIRDTSTRVVESETPHPSKKSLSHSRSSNIKRGSYSVLTRIVWNICCRIFS